MTDQSFARRCLIVLGISILALILFRTIGLLLLIFAALVFATILGAARGLITRLTKLEGPLALVAAVIPARRLAVLEPSAAYRGG